MPELVSSPEQQIFLYGSRLSIDGEAAEKLKTLLQGDVDWDVLIRATLSFGTPPLLYRNLLADFSEYIPTSLAPQLRQTFLINSIKNSGLTDKLGKLLALFAAHDIPAVPFKGPVLALSAYGDLGLRIFSDLDIIVREQDFERAKQLLFQADYRSKYEELDERYQQQAETENLQAQLENSDGSISLDLHYGIPPRRMHISSNLVWDNLESFLLSKQTIQVLKPEVHFLVLCVNGSKEAWQFFGKVCDIAALIYSHPDLDWDWIEAQAKIHHLQRIVYFALFIAHLFMGANIPSHIRTQCESHLIIKWLAVGLSQRIFPQEPSFHRLRLSWYDVGYILYINQFQISKIIGLFSSPNQADQMFLKLPKSLFFIHYLVRPFRLIFQYGLQNLFIAEKR